MAGVYHGATVASSLQGSASLKLLDLVQNLVARVGVGYLHIRLITARCREVGNGRDVGDDAASRRGNATATCRLRYGGALNDLDRDGAAGEVDGGKGTITIISLTSQYNGWGVIACNYF